MKTLNIKRHAQPEMKATESGNLRGNGVIYARSNKNGQKSPVNGLSIQVKLCRKAMERDGVNEVRSPIIDVASGMDFGRRGLKELLKLAKKNRVNYIYVNTVDRLGRDFCKTINLMNQLKELGVVTRTP